MSRFAPFMEPGRGGLGGCVELSLDAIVVRPQGEIRISPISAPSWAPMHAQNASPMMSARRARDGAWEVRARQRQLEAEAAATERQERFHQERQRQRALEHKEEARCGGDDAAAYSVLGSGVDTPSALRADAPPNLAGNAVSQLSANLTAASLPTPPSPSAPATPPSPEERRTSRLNELKQSLIDATNIGSALLICDALQRIASVNLSWISRPLLKSTRIGVEVGRLRRHGDADVRESANAIVRQWKFACGMGGAPKLSGPHSPVSPLLAVRTPPVSAQLPASSKWTTPSGTVQDARAPADGVAAEESSNTAPAESSDIAPAESSDAAPAAKSDAAPAERSNAATEGMCSRDMHATHTARDKPEGAPAPPPSALPPPPNLALRELVDSLRACSSKERIPAGVGTIVFGAPMARGQPSLGDYGIGIVTRVPVPKLDDNVCLCFLWRDPIDATAGELRPSVVLGRFALSRAKYVVVEGLPVPPYTEHDVELLRITSNNEMKVRAAAAGFELYQPDRQVHRIL